MIYLSSPTQIQFALLPRLMPLSYCKSWKPDINISNWWTFLFLHFPFCFNLFLNYVNIYFLSPYSFVTASISIYICTCTQKRIVRCVPSVQAQSWFTQPFALFSQACLLRFPFQIMPSTRGNMLSICIAAVSFISYVALKDYTKLSCVLCGSR
jgi:hypothetical protein